MRITTAIGLGLYANAIRNLARTPDPRPDTIHIAGHPVTRPAFATVLIHDQHVSPDRPPVPLISPPATMRARLRWIAGVIATPPWRRTPAPPGGFIVSSVVVTTGAQGVGVSVTGRA